jgi:UDP-N-acetylglucosamine 2-epimerase (non-hydrolysing)
MIKVMTVFGTRPEAIKMAPVIKELKKSKDIENINVFTGQHKEMVENLLKYFEIEPDYNLDIMKDRQGLVEITTRAMLRLDPIIKDEKPDILLVQGDTTTAFIAALDAFYNKVKIGHVEAGLRSWDKYQPFPEEVNRKLVGVVADLNFAPTLTSKENLLKENVDKNSIYVTGNTVIDSLFKIVEVPEPESVKDLPDGLILITAHRRENWGKPLESIVEGLKKLADTFKDRTFVYPVHLNPVVRETVFGGLKGIDNFILTEPKNYVEFSHLMKKAYIIITDSGGVQEEGPSFGKPVLVLRNTTERPEAVKAGTVKLIGTDSQNIFEEAKTLLTDKEEYNKMANAVNPYGDGNAAKRIVNNILNYFGYDVKRSEWSI